MLNRERREKWHEAQRQKRVEEEAAEDAAAAERRRRFRSCRTTQARHWFTSRGCRGGYSRYCVRCGVPNPYKPR